MIVKRKYNRERHGAQSSASHLLKIGFNAGDGNKAFFGKLRGFVVMRNETGKDGKHPVDYALMQLLIASAVQHDPRAAHAWKGAHQRLGLAYNESDPVPMVSVKRVIADHMENQLAVPDFELPTAITFEIPSAAVRNEHGEWEFPGVYTDAYIAMKQEGCPGEFCKGNGVTASRWQPDGTRRIIDCNPLGKGGIEDASLFCPYSRPVSKGVGKNGKEIWNPPPCQPVGTLTLNLGYLSADKRVVPLSRIATARYELETRSERAQMKIQQALIDAAERLNGNIAGIPGTISFNIRNVMAPHHVGATVSPQPQIDFILDSYAIDRRAAEMRSERMLTARASAAPVALLESDDEGQDGEPYEQGVDQSTTEQGHDEAAPMEESSSQPVAASAEANEQAPVAGGSSSADDGDIFGAPAELDTPTAEALIEATSYGDLIRGFRELCATTARERGIPLDEAVAELSFLSGRDSKGNERTFRAPNVAYFINVEGLQPNEIKLRNKQIRAVCKNHAKDVLFFLSDAHRKGTAA